MNSTKINPDKEHIVSEEEFKKLAKKGHQVVRIDFNNKNIIAPNKK